MGYSAGDAEQGIYSHLLADWDSIKYNSILEVLQFHLTSNAQGTAFTYLENGEEEKGVLTFRDIDRRARTIAAWLLERDLGGERVLLLYPPGLDFICGLFGCWYAGAVGVPAYPPHAKNRDARLDEIFIDAGAKAVFSVSSHEERIKPSLSDHSAFYLNTDQLTESETAWSDPGLTRDSLAILQYTSGSTGNPKGVMISHGNLLHNAWTITHQYELNKPATYVSWQPFFHDMGLVGGLLQPVYSGGHVYLMAPAAFLQRPIRWLRAINHYRASIALGPNFAYDLCCNQTTSSEREGLDLSCWRAAVSGGEPVRAVTLNKFNDIYQQFGFKRETFMPAYGMAETTLGVTSVLAQKEPAMLTCKNTELEHHKVELCDAQHDDAIYLVSSGSTGDSHDGARLAIVDPDSMKELGEGQVGEIWVAGSSVAQGYWNKQQQSIETFQANINGAADRQNYLRTGDMGFVMCNELYATGRLKDLIIIHGRNIYPQDIEHAIEQSHFALQTNTCAAFSIDIDDHEELIIVVEVKRVERRRLDKDGIFKAISSAVLQQFGVTVYGITLIKPHSAIKTSSGKIMRKASRKVYLAKEYTILGEWIRPRQTLQLDARVASLAFDSNRVGAGPRHQQIKEFLCQLVAEQMGLSNFSDTQAGFAQLGIDSIAAVGLVSNIQAMLPKEMELSATLLFDYPNIDAIATYLEQQFDGEANHLFEQPSQAVTDTPIAVVGLSCRFPGANNIDEFWQLLEQGKNAISPIPSDRWESLADKDQLKAEHYGGFITDIDKFDPVFFGISPREAVSMDPQHRLIQEQAWYALEQAAISPLSLKNTRTGVFIGISTSDYADILKRDSTEGINAYLGTGMAHSSAAGRLSYVLGLKGPSMALDTACSSSLVAVHQAAESLRRGECDLALVGGVNAILSEDLMSAFSQAQMLSPSGQCHTFDAAADGYVRGEGCGMLVLKRSADCQQHSDRIFAVLQGSAVNQDGPSSGFTVPNGPSQQEVIHEALHNANVQGKDIDYLEAHGTGTSLGDPIEVQAAAEVLARDRKQASPLLVGSVKTNIGHLEAAAGIAGLIKVILSLQHQTLPRHLHYHTPNPHIPWDKLAIRVNQSNTPWPVGDTPRLAGVSSFGFSGTNAHVILAEAPRVEAADANELASRRTTHLLTLSAKSAEALTEMKARYLSQLEQYTDELAALCYTSNSGRSHFNYRLAVTASSQDELTAQLQASTEVAVYEHTVPPKVGFLFSGQGAQLEGMGSQLYQTHPIYRTVLDRCTAILQDYDLDLHALLGSEKVHTTRYTQPLLFSVEYALAQLWLAWGVQPWALMGHSIGEYVAACVAGVFSLEDALKLVVHRGRLMDSAPGDGAMYAVFATPAEVAPYLEAYPKISIAAVNGPGQIVLSGCWASLHALCEQLTEAGMDNQRLQVSHGFHSPLMEPILHDFRAIAETVSYQPAQMTLISNVTGERIGEQISHADYWCEHIRATVQFNDGLQAMAQQGVDTFVELGPQPVLTALGQKSLVRDEVCWLASLRRGQDEWATMMAAVGQLYRRGMAFDWPQLHQGACYPRVDLPSYPFKRERYWPATTPQRENTANTGSSSSTRQTSRDYLYQLDWQAQDAISETVYDSPVSDTWLLFIDGTGTGAALVQQLRAIGKRCIVVTPSQKKKGEGQHGVYNHGSDKDHYAIDLTDDEAYQSLFHQLGQSDENIAHVVHLWGVSKADPNTLDGAALWQQQEVGSFSLLKLVQTVVQQSASSQKKKPPRLTIICADTQQIENEALCLPQGPLWALGGTVATEHPELRVRCIDISLSDEASNSDMLMREVLSADHEDRIALRHNKRYIARLIPIKKEVLSENNRQAPLIKHDGAYLITGGLGGLGLYVARWLAEEGARAVILVSRRGVVDDAMQQVVDELQGGGLKVYIFSADITDATQLENVFTSIRHRGYTLRGIVHAAGVLDDGILLQQNTDRFRAVMNPKLIGAWNLHQLSQDSDLDFFVCFSSIASVLGSPGQGNYVAANGFLDILMHHRQQLGLPGLAINWGPWSSVGMAEDVTAGMMQAINKLLPAQGIALLSQGLNQSLAQLAAVDIDWDQLAHRIGTEHTPPLLQSLIQPSNQEAGISTFKTRLTQLNVAERKDELVKYLQITLATALGFAHGNIVSPQQALSALGLDSLIALEVRNTLEKTCGLSLASTILFNYPTIDELAHHLLSEMALGDGSSPVSASIQSEIATAETTRVNDIAVVGVACRFPGQVSSPDDFWSLLENGVDAIEPIPSDRWSIDDYFDPDPDAPNRMNIKRGGFIRDVEAFDAAFFGIAPREAEAMDPQQRILLETAYAALEHANIPAQSLVKSESGVFIGIGSFDNVLRTSKAGQNSDRYTGIGNSLSAAAGRLSYTLGLVGPSMAIDTACSSSLVSVHLACRHLQLKECELALAAGVNMLLSPELMIGLSDAHMLAPDGHCKTFDAAADGYVRSEGCGVVVLKRLDDAIEANDRILAVIRGSATNQDGPSGGLTVPNSKSQQAVIQRALANAAVSPKDVRYVEAHGTGTSLGDPIEIEALSEVYGVGRLVAESDDKHKADLNPTAAPLLVGSVKTNIGHLEAAAGMAGLIKVILSLHHQSIPRHLHYTTPNPHIPWDKLAIQVTQSNTPWPIGDTPRLAGVSSFGFSGTNAHVIVAEPPREQMEAANEQIEQRNTHLLTLSAKSTEALTELKARYLRQLEQHTDELAALCYTSNRGRSHFNHRLAVIASTQEELTAQLQASTEVAVYEHTVPPKVGFLFSGQGAQLEGMGSQLYQTHPIYRAALDRCAAILQTHELSLMALLETDKLHNTRYTQPALFSVEYALAQLWLAWGVQPWALMGHSIGEYVAACVAGVFSLEDALKLVVHRGRLMDSAPGDGAMYAVFATPAEVAPYIEAYPKVSIAAVNGPGQIVLSGCGTALSTLCEQLTEAGMSSQRLQVSHGFHSPLMDPILDEFRGIAETVSYQPAQMTLISNVTGGRIGEQISHADYWCEHIRATVQFNDGLQAMAQQGVDTFVELGPQPVLTALGQKSLVRDDVSWVTSLRRGQDEWATMMAAVGQLYHRGVVFDWSQLHQGACYPRVDLPLYPFHKTYFKLAPLDSPSAHRTPAHDSSRVSMPTKEQEKAFISTLRDKRRFSETELQLLPDLFVALRQTETDQSCDRNGYTLNWIERSLQHDDVLMSEHLGDTDSVWLILSDKQGHAEQLKAALHTHCADMRIITVYDGEMDQSLAANDLSIDRSQQDCFEKLLRHALIKNAKQLNIINLLGLNAPSISELELNSQLLMHSQEYGVLALLQLVKALSETVCKTKLWLVTANAVNHFSDDASSGLAMSPLWGAAKSLDLEMPGLLAGIVDVDNLSKGQSFKQLALELLSSHGEKYIRFEDGVRHVQRLMKSETIQVTAPSVQEEASYLITGGTGALGIRVAQRLVRAGARRLILVSRHGCRHEQCRKAIDALKANDVEIIIKTLDISCESDVAQLFKDIHSMPALRGIVHAAGLSGFELIPTLEQTTVVEMLQAKMVGGWLLHQYSQSLSLDFFVCFSSIASVWGSKGQYHYAAANAFLDALCHYRHSLDLSATSINWGPWAEGGMVDAHSQELLNRIGIKLLEPDDALNAFDALLSSTTTQVLVADVDWAKFKPVFESGTTSSLLHGIVTEDGHSTVAQVKTNDLLHRRLQTVSVPERLRLLTTTVVNILQDVLKITEQQAAVLDQGFFEMGIDSLMTVELQKLLNNALNLDMPVSVIFDTATPRQLVEHINELMFPVVADDPLQVADGENIKELSSTEHDEPIAIIGMDCRFPSANSTSAFWSLLEKGECTVTEVPAERWDIDKYNQTEHANTGNRYGSFVDHIDQFDPEYFGITQIEANNMDPQQRLLLEVSWRALEDAGYREESGSSNQTGVFIGITAADYLQLIKDSHNTTYINPHLITGNALNAAAGRVAYTFGFEGPCMAIDTACSSSLVAIHNACQSLRHGECEMALAGGVNALLAPDNSLAAANANMLSADGLCHTFDINANGYVRGEGCGVVVLKRLSAAKHDGDRIWALIRGSALAQDGRSAGLTVPNGTAQQKLIRKALHDAHINAADITYVEAHGTGTPLGDPIEMNALQAVFGDEKTSLSPLLVGSVKTNVGHLESAAGVCSLIKVVLSLTHDKIPAHLHLNQPNPKIDWQTIPIEVPSKTVDWRRTDDARIAGISSFGFTGTLAHLIVEEAPIDPPRQQIESQSPQLLTLSARSEHDLIQLRQDYIDFLADGNNQDFGDIAYSANARRKHYAYRQAIVCISADDARKQLEAYAQQDRQGTLDERGIALLFKTEQINQLCQACIPLLEFSPVVADYFAQCETLFKEHLSLSLSSALQMRLNDDARTPEMDIALHFSLQFAVAQLWRSLGVNAEKIICYGMGRFAAICIAGFMDLSTMIRLISRIIQGADKQALLASGDIDKTKVQALDIALIENGTLVDRPISNYADIIALLAIEQTATINPAVTDTDGSYTIIDIGRGDREHQSPNILSSIGMHADGCTALLETLGTLYTFGSNINWSVLYQHSELKTITIPGHPFNNRRCWFEEEGEQTGKESSALNNAATSRLGEISYYTKWIEAPTASAHHLAEIPCQDEPVVLIVSVGDKGLTDAIVSTLYQQGQQVCAVLCSDTVQLNKNSTMSINASQVDSFDLLFEALHQQSVVFDTIMFIGATNAELENDVDTPVLRLNDNIVDQCLAVIHLVQALAKRKESHTPKKLIVLSQGAERIDGDTHTSHTSACLLALGRVIASEYPAWPVRLIDVAYRTCDVSAQTVVNEINRPDGDLHIGLRQDKRFIPKLVHAKDIQISEKTAIREDASYVISGGLGAIGLNIAHQLAELGVAHIILISRRKPTGELTQTLESIQQLGTKISVLSADIADEMAIQNELTRLEKLTHPVRGIIHAAGVLDDGVIINMNAARLRHVFLAKIVGTTVLHRFAIGRAIDFFVCFSSMAAISGTAGQSNYAVANAYMDALCLENHVQGRPYLAINWGPWGELGMASNTTYGEDYYKSHGIKPLTSAEGIDALFSLLNNNAGQVSIIDADWNKLRQSGMTPSQAAICSHLISTSELKTEHTLPGNKRLHALLEGSSEQRQKEILSEHVKQLLIKMSGINIAQFLVTEPLLHYGIDSLVMLQLGHRISDDIGVKLDMAQLPADISTTELTELVFKTRMASMNRQASINEISASKAKELLDKFDELDEEEIDSLLNELAD